MKRAVILLFIVVAVGFWVQAADAGRLTYRRDTISVSAPASGSDHAIEFTTFTEIPVSGRIVITPEPGDFTIPAAMDFSDVDLLVDGVQRTVAAAAGSGAGSAVGVTVVSGTSGSITFILNDSDVIAATSSVSIRIGTNATFGATGDQQITNPNSVGSYTMDFETQNAGGTTLDDGGTIIAIVERVGLSAQAGVTATPTPTEGAGGGRGPMQSPGIDNIIFWATSLDTLTVQQFSGSSADAVAALLSQSTEAFYSDLVVQYTVLMRVSSQELASVLGLSMNELYDLLVSQYPSISSMTRTQFANATVQDIASIAGISVQELYSVLNLSMQDVASLADTSVSALYDFLSIGNLDKLQLDPSDRSETTISATVTESSGTVQLGIAGESISFVTDTAGSLGLTKIEDGTWQFTTYAQASTAVGQTTLSAQILVVDGDGNETLLFTHTITNELSDSLTRYITYSDQLDFTFDPDDRVIIRYFASTSGTSQPVTVTLYYEGTDHYSNVQTPPSDVPSPCTRIADFTGDCLVNIVDLSIMMYNWPIVRNEPDTDLNEDGTVGIIDFSILLFWWTG